MWHCGQLEEGQASFFSVEFRFHAGLQHLLPLKRVWLSIPPGVIPRNLVTRGALQIIDRQTDASKRWTHRNMPEGADRRSHRRADLGENLGLWKWLLQLLRYDLDETWVGWGRSDLTQTPYLLQVLAQALPTSSSLSLQNLPSPPTRSGLAHNLLLQRALPASPALSLDSALSISASAVVHQSLCVSLKMGVVAFLLCSPQLVHYF